MFQSRTVFGDEPGPAHAEQHRTNLAIKDRLGANVAAEHARILGKLQLAREQLAETERRISDADARAAQRQRQATEQLLRMKMEIAELREKIDEPPDQEAPMVSVTRIVREVALAFKIDHRLIYAVSRQGEILPARTAVYFICRALTTLSLPALARQLQRGCHTTILHGIERCRKRMAAEPEYKNLVERVLNKIQNAQYD